MKFAIVTIAILPWLLACAPRFHEGPLPDTPKDATFEEVDGVRLRYVDVGQGPAVVLLHGFSSHLDRWAPVIPPLARNHRVIALDLKGFGWSERPPGDYSPPAQARLVLGLLAKRGVHRFALVGHSWGSSVALAIALMAPDQVTRIALYDAFVYEEQIPPSLLWSRVVGVGEMVFGLWYTELLEPKIRMAFYDGRYVTDELVAFVDKLVHRPGTKAVALASVRGMHYAHVQHRYREIKKPALILWGREDIVTPLPFGERLASDLGARLVVYPQCGHFPMVEAREASTRDLVAFLAEDLS